MIIAMLALALAAGAPERLEPIVRNGDYPAEALRNGEEGSVRARLTIGVDGRVKACEIIETSRSRSLDRKTCDLLRERARFAPATDDKGRPTEGSFTTGINWKLPK